MEQENKDITPEQVDQTVDNSAQGAAEEPQVEILDEQSELQAQIDKLNKKNGSTVVVPKAPHVKEDTKAYSAWDNSGLI